MVYCAIFFKVMIEIVEMNEEITKYFTIYENQKLNLSPNNLFGYNLTLLHCLLECTQFTGCHSVNHHLDRDPCEVLFQSSDGASSLHDATGWNFYQRERFTIS